MPTLKIPARRLLLAGGFAVAIAAAPAAVIAAPTHSVPSIAACPGGESEDTFTGECTPDLVPNSPEVGVTSPGGLPEVDNIPCTGGNSGQCIGLSEEEQAAGPQPVPHSTISSSP
ncbi:intersectin-EH binding protein Ibp1 [Mycobacterium sp. ACS1612]|uniref:intersectin-EH binding protein Ibp1 n=1 Tax=Mycobacterium sp. ACS1612 TaxID=1834117 RepID=UPI0007FE2A5B|nr:intersectin-EH binding protein Ibp1 [Mycobacterium sp. ACS1612]OBF41196.1 intersectin-EH binding protein Ibp1 [Mycobacterium sp. ACS1612]